MRWDRPWIVEPGARDHRPFLALLAFALLVALAFALPASRAWLVDDVLGPVRAQADPDPRDDGVSYSVASLAFWALAGAVFAWAAYEIVFVRLRVEADRRFFASLAPFLLFGPLVHALLVAGAFPEGSAQAYLAAEPPVYLTTGAFALVAFGLGALARRPFAVAGALGAAALVPLVALAAPLVEAEAARRALILLAVAGASALVVGTLCWRMRRREPLAAVLAVVGAHALDGATTWMVLRDPLGLGFESFAEKNPVSLALIELSNGWPYFAVKLALPVLLLLAVRVDDSQRRLHAFLLLAVFVLGYGPGMSNLLQVLLG